MMCFTLPGWLVAILTEEGEMTEITRADIGKLVIVSNPGAVGYYEHGPRRLMDIVQGDSGTIRYRVAWDQLPGGGWTWADFSHARIAKGVV